MKKTQKVMIGVTGTALLIGMTGCSSGYAEPNEKPDDPYCSDWDWDGEDAVWVCDDDNSSYHGSYYHGGKYYSSKSSLKSSSAYKQYKSSISSKSSSGFGSGSKVFGG
ncbi:aminotransferase yhxA [Caldifermentibacillus hisashii]|uniref:aminotransferase yhxA n=1 Tax=Caldifermentibacillus hisashii TaxID=996558 RepID=UPI0031B68071